MLLEEKEEEDSNRSSNDSIHPDGDIPPLDEDHGNDCPTNDDTESDSSGVISDSEDDEEEKN